MVGTPHWLLDPAQQPAGKAPGSPRPAAGGYLPQWKRQTGLEVYLVFEPFADLADGHAESLDTIPLARIVTRQTARCMHLDIAYRAQGRMHVLASRTALGGKPITYMMDGLTLGPCTINWSRECDSWSVQLKKAGLIVITVF
jgi:hypothetical protein